MTDHDKPFSRLSRAGRTTGGRFSSPGQQPTHPRSTAHLFLFCHSHGGTGCGSVHTITAQTARQTRPDSTDWLGCAALPVRWIPEKGPQSRHAQGVRFYTFWT
jgi:hypothetical protein